MPDQYTRIESELAVQSYLNDLKYALDHGAKIEFQAERFVDRNRPEQYTNKFTIADLFPDENPTDVLDRELRELTAAEYMQTVKDIRYKNRSDMWEFGKTYGSKGDVYIKIRVELLASYGNHTCFVMSFHYAVKPFKPSMFPYRK